MAEILDSGNRTEFSTGAVRDVQEGKGRCDLLPLDIISSMCNNVMARNVLHSINCFMHTGETKCIRDAMNNFIFNEFNSQYDAFLELSRHFEDGCRKYGPRNWEKGIPLSRYIDSGIRHFLKYLREDKDERHDRAFLWNMTCLLWTLKNVPEMNDLPFAQAQKEVDPLAYTE